VSRLTQGVRGRTLEAFAAATRNGQELVLWGGQATSSYTGAHGDWYPDLIDTWAYAAGRWRLVLPN
jgi:hypothetical protein